MLPVPAQQAGKPQQPNSKVWWTLLAAHAYYTAKYVHVSSNNKKLGKALFARLMMGSTGFE